MAGKRDNPEKIVAADLLSDPGTQSVAMQILSTDITHKSDVGGVLLNLETPAEVRHAANALLRRVARVRPDASVQGVVVQPMIRHAGADELIAGINLDRVFGPVIMFGEGGTSVEVVADKALGLPPLDEILAADMIDATRISKLLDGYRDRPQADKAAIIRILV